MDQFIPAIVALACFIATVLWGRSARLRLRVVKRLDATSGDSDAKTLARSDLQRNLHATVMYATLTLIAGVQAFSDSVNANVVLVLLAVPLTMTFLQARNAKRDARLAQGRSQLEQRAQEVLTQEDLAPRRWAARLAPEALPGFAGFELGSAYQAGSGMLAGDFYDVFRVAPSRVAAVIGDVTGHGIEPSITAFQCKYLLRVFLRQFRDPAQAIEELNTQMSALERDEEFISVCIVIFDSEAETLRYSSAGHPAAWLVHEREVRPLRATGPLLMLDPEGHYISREIPLSVNDMLLLYTDGLAEARDGEQLFGEERIAAMMRRDPTVSPDVLCKSLLEAATDFASVPMDDDVAILAIRKV